jgi:hypothetical protein
MLIKKAEHSFVGDYASKLIFEPPPPVFGGWQLRALLLRLDSACVKSWRPPRFWREQRSMGLKEPAQHSETLTPFKDVSSYNNYYEFSTEKTSRQN